MRNGFALALSLGLLTTSSAIAHDTLPTKWCPAGSTVTTVATFDLTPLALASYRTQHLSGGRVLGSGCYDLKTCGIVDDWFWANEAAHETCTGHQLKNAQTAPAMPFVTYPATFNLNEDLGPDGIPNGIKDHHDQYKFKSGLKGVCVVCKPTTATPTPSAPATTR